MQVIPVPQLSDNYAYLVLDDPSHQAGIVDCAEAEPVLHAAREHHATLTCILPTHHHWDHIGGNEDLLKSLRLEVYGYAGQGQRIPGCTREVNEGDVVHVGNLAVRII